MLCNFKDTIFGIENYFLDVQMCSGQKMPDSCGRHSEALGNLGSGNLEGGGTGERVEKGEVSLQAT
jgi:hypothetical protein